MKEAIVMNKPTNQPTNQPLTLKHTMKNQLEGEHINGLQEWEGLSSG
jgi:hypothetical protein